MPATVIDVARAEDARDVIHRAVQALAERRLVGLPTETVYGVAASATHPEAVARLAEAKGRADESPFVLAVIVLGSRVRRLATRCISCVLLVMQ